MRKIFAACLAVIMLLTAVPVGIAEDGADAVIIAEKEEIETSEPTTEEEVVSEEPAEVHTEPSADEQSQADAATEDDAVFGPGDEGAQNDASEEDVVIEDDALVEPGADEEEGDASEDAGSETEVVGAVETAEEDETISQTSTNEYDEPAAEDQPQADFVIEESTLIEYCGDEIDVVVPEEITIIGEEAFKDNEDIESVHFSGKVVTIEEKAFAGCKMLEEVTFEYMEELKEIADYAFQDCVKLDFSWIEDAEIEHVSETAFEGCIIADEEKTDEVVVPDKEQSAEGEDEVEVIEDKPVTIKTQPADQTGPVGSKVYFTVEAEGENLTYQWQYSSNGTSWLSSPLTGSKTASLTVPVTESRGGMYYRCVITGSGSVQVISEAAQLIIGENVVTEFTVDNVCYGIIDETTVNVKSYNGTAASVVIPETVQGYTVTAIGKSAFEDNTTLTSIDLPDTIVVIGERAFANCTNLSEMK